MNNVLDSKFKGCESKSHRPLSRRLDRCDRVIQNESSDSIGGNVKYVTMQITFVTSKFRNEQRNLHCDIVHITTKWVFCLTLDCNGVFAIKAYTYWARFFYLRNLASFVYPALLVFFGGDIEKAVGPFYLVSMSGEVKIPHRR